MMDGGIRTHGVGKFHFQPILASASYRMPESNAFWTLPESETWRGPFYGFQTVDFVIGESFTATRGGHYGKWLADNHLEVVDLYLPENGLDEELDEMDEVWRALRFPPICITTAGLPIVQSTLSRTRQRAIRFCSSCPFQTLTTRSPRLHPIATP